MATPSSSTIPICATVRLAESRAMRPKPQHALSRPNGETSHIDHAAGCKIFGFSAV